MHVHSENILLIGSVLLLLSILGGKTTSRWGVPTLIFFLLVGILAGSEGIGGIPFDDPPLAQLVGIVALNFILFSGGLSTNFRTIEPVLKKGLALSTMGVVLTALSVGVFVHFLLGFSMPVGLLLGAIISSTDAAAVFSILRGRGVHLKGDLAHVLELESGSNDPMAYFLTISLTAIAKEGSFHAGELLLLCIKGFVIGALMGYATGKGSLWLINRIHLPNKGLYFVLLMGLALFSYSATETLGGNGFLSIYICAVLLGSSDFVHKRILIQFYDGIAWLMQIILFLTLGLLVFPSRVLAVAGPGLLISGFLIFVARPIGVFGALAFFKSVPEGKRSDRESEGTAPEGEKSDRESEGIVPEGKKSDQGSEGTDRHRKNTDPDRKNTELRSKAIDLRSKLFLSWVGLRGAVPIVFATYPLIAGLPESNLIFNLVFFIAVSSVLVQGTTLPAVARRLNLTVPDSK